MSGGGSRVDGGGLGEVYDITSAQSKGSISFQPIGSGTGTLDLQVVVNTGNLLYPSIKLFNAVKRLVQVGSIVCLGETLRETGDNVVTKEFFLHMKGMGLKGVVGVGEGDDPVFERDVTLGADEAGHERVLPLARQPLQLELGDEIVERHFEEVVVVVFDPGKNVIALKTVHHTTCVLVRWDRLRLEGTAARNGKVPNALECDTSSAEHRIPVGRALGDDSHSGMGRRGHDQAYCVVAVVGVREAVRVGVHRDEARR